MKLQIAQDGVFGDIEAVEEMNVYDVLMYAQVNKILHTPIDKKKTKLA